ncbi:hypothetical protein F5Y10DRAFT_235938 [Nemania abortiva]|nr:hypothetical protein F5Y10DRAFT_235938 [Nemania abortiva]
MSEMTARSLGGGYDSVSPLPTHHSQEDDTIMPQKNVSYLMGLPIELILLISEQLAKADAVCFALTCKALLQILTDPKYIRSHNLKRLDPEAKEALLIRLERVLPMVVYCPSLGKLVPFNQRGRIRSQSLDGRERYSPCFSPATYSDRPSNHYGAQLTYERIRLLRNYRLFGPLHGVPLSFLSHKTRRLTSTPAIYTYMGQRCEKYTNNSQTGKWVGDNLFLSCIKTIFFDGLKKGDLFFLSSMAFRDLMRETGMPVCHHLTTDSPDHGGYSYLTVYAHFRVSKEHEYHGTESCMFCETDWDFSLSWDNSLDCLNITYTSYHDLGRCSPWDLKWEKLTSSVYPGTTTNRLGRGEVKRQWMEAS